MHSDRSTIVENGINFEVIPRPSVSTDMVVVTFVDANAERHKLELAGIEMNRVIEQLIQFITIENIPFANRANLFVNPSNPIFSLVVRNSEQSFAPPSTVSSFNTQTHSPYR